MTELTFNYVWVIYPKSGGDVKVYSNLNKIISNLSNNNAKSIRKVQTGNNSWEMTVDGKGFVVKKQKIEDSNGL